MPSLVSFGSNLRGNAAAVHVCAGDSSVTPCAGDSSDGNAIRGTFRLELLQHFTAHDFRLDLVRDAGTRRLCSLLRMPLSCRTRFCSTLLLRTHQKSCDSAGR